MLTNVLSMFDQFLIKFLSQIICLWTKAWDAINHILTQVKAIQIIENNHIERSRGRPLFLITSNVQILMIGSAVEQAMN